MNRGLCATADSAEDYGGTTGLPVGLHFGEEKRDEAEVGEVNETSRKNRDDVNKHV
jgi:hypothetical protein